MAGVGLIDLRFPFGGQPAAEAEGQGRHAWARQIIRQAFRQTMGREGSPAELQAAQAIGLGESGYGRGWGSEGGGSNNWGAAQSHREPCGPDTFAHGDTHPTASGSIPYRVCFRRYASDVDGAADMIRLMYRKRPKVLAAVHRGSLEAFSTGMYGYYEGVGPDKASRIRWHMKAVAPNLKHIAKALGEPVYLNGPPSSSGGGGLALGALLLGGLLLARKALR